MRGSAFFEPKNRQFGVKSAKNGTKTRKNLKNLWKPNKSD
jgi:hypothetical protein